MRRSETDGFHSLLGLIELEQGRAAGRPVIVALDGRSGCGKSFLASRLSRELDDLTVVQMDDFYRELPQETRMRLTAEEGVEEFFDWQGLRRAVLEPLRAGDPADFRPFDWPAGRMSDAPARLPPAPLVVLEGVYSARAELRDLLDIAVLVEVEESVRQGRLAERHDDPPELAERWEAAEDYYFRALQSAQGFDLVIDGSTA